MATALLPGQLPTENRWRVLKTSASILPIFCTAAMRFIFSSARAMRSLLVPRELTCATCAFSLRIRTERMTLLAWIAAVVLFLQLPIPLYWFVLHPARNFWSARRNAAYIVALALSWLPVTLLLIAYHRHLLRPDTPPLWRVVLGIVLIALEVWIFWRVKRDLGGARLVGATELSGGGQMEESGIYSRIRHPRYSGSFLALIGASLLAATDRKSTRLNSSHVEISYAVFCLKK